VTHLRSAAVYARYSTDRQSPTSIDDQVRKCRQYAEVNGLHVDDQHIYADRGFSGVGSDRPALKRVLDMALSCNPPFTAILVDDTSRLSRTTEEALSIFKRLNFAGVQLIAVSQGIDSAHEQSEMLVTVHGLVDSLYVRELAKKIHRGLEGLALRGLHTGGRVFGYDAVSTSPEATSKKLVVNQAEAAIVTRIFEMSAAGHSLKSIARTLNAESVAAPRPRDGRIGGEWCPTAIREMLKNELYIGNVVWNRSKFVKVPGTNRRQRRMRPESEWLRRANPELVIITEDLWKAVRERFAAFPTWGYQKKPGLLPRGMTSPHLFSGLLKCGECGANLIIATGGGTHRHPKYACSRRFNRGGCENDLYIRRDDLEDMMLKNLQAKILSPEAIEYAIAEYREQLGTALKALSGDLAEMRQRKARIEADVNRLVAAVSEVGHSKALLNELARKENELQGITDRLLSSGQDSIEARIGEIRTLIMGGIENLRDLLRKDTALARTELLKHSGEIRMTPNTAVGHRFYVAEGTWDLLGRDSVLDQRRQRDDWRLRMVAGVGFEPTTFGL
jgi:site-specific DNA recombinase